MRRDDSDRALLTFHGPVKMHERRGLDGHAEYVVVPLSDAALLEVLAEKRSREAWYAGVAAALRAIEIESINAYPVTLERTRAVLATLRHPKDVRDE